MKKSLGLPSEFLKVMSSQQQEAINTIEDRIEQKHKAMDIVLSLNVINGIVGKRPDDLTDAQRRTLEQSVPLVEEIHRALADREETQLDKDRRAIWGMVRRSGVAYVLSFVDSQLVTNIEKFFVGLVITYVAMFTSGRREQLRSGDVFIKDSPEADLHKYFFDLRNKWYAHNASQYGRHSLKYFIDTSGELIFDKMGEQITPEYHEKQFRNLFKCVVRTLEFLEKDIDDRVDSFKETLSAAQNNILFQYWKAQGSRTA